MVVLLLCSTVCEVLYTEILQKEPSDGLTHWQPSDPQSRRTEESVFITLFGFCLPSFIQTYQTYIKFYCSTAANQGWEYQRQPIKLTLIHVREPRHPPPQAWLPLKSQTCPCFIKFIRTLSPLMWTFMSRWMLVWFIQHWFDWEMNQHQKPLRSSREQTTLTIRDVSRYRGDDAIYCDVLRYCVRLRLN